MDIGFETFPDEGKIDEGGEEPSDHSDDDSDSEKGAESSSDPGDKIGPDHPPWRTDILDKFRDSCRLYRIYQSFDLIEFIRRKRFE